MNIHVITLSNRIDMRLNSSGKDTPVILTSLHHHGKVSELRSTIVNVQTKEVILKDTLRCIALAVAIIFVHLHQNIKGIH